MKLLCPEPPAPTVRRPASDDVKVRVLPEPVTTRFGVSPLKADVEVAIVTVGPLCVWPAGPSAVMPPEEGDVVAMSFPFGSTARKVPAGTPRAVSHSLPETVSAVVEAPPLNC